MSAAVGLAAFALPATVAVRSAYGTPSEDLWAVMAEVESGGNLRAYNPHDGATRIIQIRTVCLTDCNRIARRQGAGREFTLPDRLRPGENSPPRPPAHNRRGP